ncbi:hypothetical protein AOLI_G00073850 [Acnodon oligacanthus]
MPGTKGNKSDKKSATKLLLFEYFEPSAPAKHPLVSFPPHSNLRVLRSSRRKVIRKEMTIRSKEDSRRERSSNFQAFVKMALETLLGSCRRKYGGPRGRQG